MAMVTIEAPTGSPPERAGVDEAHWNNGEDLLADGTPSAYAGWTKIADNVPAVGNLGDPTPMLVGGSWDNHVIAQQRKLEDVANEMDIIYAMGWTYDWGGTIGVHVLDCRPGTDDKPNWTLLLMETDAKVAAGLGSDPEKVVTAHNESIFPTAADANVAMKQMLAWGKAVLAHKWALSDQVKAATDQAALDAIDVTAGWPS